LVGILAKCWLTEMTASPRIQVWVILHVTEQIHAISRTNEPGKRGGYIGLNVNARRPAGIASENFSVSAVLRHPSKELVHPPKGFLRMSPISSSNSSRARFVRLY
jgi:hypothetical protein